MAACWDLEEAPAGYRCIEVGPVVVEWDVEDSSVVLPASDDFYSVSLETPAQVQDLIEALQVALGWFGEEVAGESA